MECPNCKTEMEWTRYKDVPLDFDETTRYVTINAYLCPKCDTLETEVE